MYEMPQTHAMVIYKWPYLSNEPLPTHMRGGASDRSPGRRASPLHEMKSSFIFPILFPPFQVDYAGLYCCACFLPDSSLLFTVPQVQNALMERGDSSRRYCPSFRSASAYQKDASGQLNYIQEVRKRMQALCRNRQRDLSHRREKKKPIPGPGNKGAQRHFAPGCFN